MEFLSTPDLGHGVRWSSTPGPVPHHPSASPVVPGATPSAVPSGPAHPTATPTAHPAPSPSPNSTPHAPSSAFYAPVDRAGIKNSFQSLFSPAVAGTPALFSRPPHPAPGLTPFINGMPTPSLVPPASAMLSNYPPLSTPHIDPTARSPNPAAATPAHGAPLSSPFLQAAAKEAVRREFLNMPNYVSPATDRTNSDKEFQQTPSHHHPQQHASVASPATIPSPASIHGTQQVSPNSGDAKVPSNSSPVSPTSPHRTDAKSDAQIPVPQQNDDKTQLQRPQQPGVPPQVQPYFMPPQPHPHGMVMIGQHGQMMMAAPPGAMYAPPGVVMFAGGQPSAFPQGMMMPGAHNAQMQRPQGQPVKPETQAERKERIEHEKQELIREFKKKTREAALVRFRQKRRERRFGKLIRYDCRKKLADARPRVKGRFVRIKDDDESEGAQVVPGMN